MAFLLTHLLPAFTILVWNFGIILIIAMAGGHSAHLESRFKYKPIK